MQLEGVELHHYRLMKRIGSGGMGEVYQAEDMRIARQVAIKVVRIDTTSSSGTDEAQETALRAIAMPDHPHILPVFDFGEKVMGTSRLFYTAMPYCREGSLADWLQQRGNTGPLLLQDVVHIIEQAADALQHAHDHNLVHRNVKLSNFLIHTRQNSPNRPDVLLADFYVPCFSTTTASLSERTLLTYRAPEQWRGRIGPATDQYSLAVMVYQLLTSIFHSMICMW